MTLKYESDLLYELMKRDGDAHPSDVLPYESELKEKYVNQVVGAYPKLQDYRPEWLNYNLYHHLPSDFPVESVTNVTHASFQNVVPYAYGKALLKGQTLVNVKPKTNLSTWGTSSYDSDSGICTINASNSGIRFNIDLLKTSTKYLVIFDIVELPTFAEESATPIKLALGHSNYNYLNINRDELKVGTLRKIVTTYNEFTELMTISNRGSFSTPIKLRFMILEYQDGMENWDIPYFEGMQSVKMPVLTTSNEDGTKTNILTVNEDVTLRGIGDVQDTLDCLTGEVTERVGEIVLDGSDDEDWRIELFENGGRNYLRFMSPLDNVEKDGFALCDKLPSLKGDVFNTDYVRPSANRIWVYKKDLTLTLQGFINELKNNPITVQYQLKLESIKTVDLTCTNEQGEDVDFMPIEGTMHVSTSSNGLQPLLDMTVPVEAITQNLNSFANMEKEE